MAKSDAFETQFLQLIFNGTAIPDLAENDSSTPATSLTVALHTADPGEAGNQSTNELTYIGYARVPVDRDGTGWVVTDNKVSPAENVVFGVPTDDAGEVITFFSVGTGTGNAMLYSGPLTSSSTVVLGAPPTMVPSSFISED